MINRGGGISAVPMDSACDFLLDSVGSLWYSLGRSLARRRMKMQINFEGYWRIPTRGVADYPGIYCIYASASSMNYLLYIGSAENVGHRVAQLGKRQDWARVANGYPLYFSAAEVAEDSIRKRAEAAMIFRFKPPCNVMHVKDFPFPDTKIEMSGPVASANTRFEVRDSRASYVSRLFG